MSTHLSPNYVNIRRSDMVPLKPCLLEEIHWRIFTNPFGKVFFFSLIFHEPFIQTNFLRADRSSCKLCVNFLQVRDGVVFSHDAYTTFSLQVAIGYTEEIHTSSRRRLLVFFSDDFQTFLSQIKLLKAFKKSVRHTIS